MESWRLRSCLRADVDSRGREHLRRVADRDGNGGRPVRCSGRDADDDSVVRPEFDVSGDPSGKGDGSSGDADLALEGTLGRGIRDAFTGRTEADSFDLDGAGQRVYAARWGAAVGQAVTVGDLAVGRVVERRRGVTHDQYG